MNFFGIFGLMVVSFIVSLYIISYIISGISAVQNGYSSGYLMALGSIIIGGAIIASTYKFVA